MAREQLVIHAGTHKTGSSAIQRYLYEHRAALSGQGVNYLHRGKANSSLWMLRAFKRDLDGLPAFKHLDLDEAGIATLRKRAQRRLAKEAEASDAALSVLSAESIALFSLEELQALFDVTSSLYGTVSIHQYFRPMKARMESAYQERLKHGFSAMDKKFHLAYNRQIEMLDSVFGRENVGIHKYDGAVFPGGDVVKHFLQLLNIDPPVLPDSTTANAGLSLPAARLLYVYRLFNPKLLPGDRDIVKVLRTLPGADFRFHSSLYESLLATGPKMVTLFERRAGFSISEDTTADDDTGIQSEQAMIEVTEDDLRWLQQRVVDSAGEALPATADLESIAALVARLTL